MEQSYLNLSLFHHICGACIYGAASNVPHLLLYVAIFCAKFLVYIIPLHIIYLFLQCEYNLALKIIVALCVAIIFSLLLGHLFYEPRPFLIQHDLAIMKHRDSSSFPSNHAMVFAVYVYFLVRYVRNSSKYVALCFMLLTCWARIFTAIHYPIDIIGGIIIGITSAFLVDKIRKK